jgi:protein-S-isoprenylcysteine O-methyltransferase Ste14
MIIRNVVWIMLALSGFAVVHSLTAGLASKEKLKKILDDRLVEGWYRLVFNIFSGITLLPTLALVAFLPDHVLYQVGMPWALLMGGLQLLGLLGLAGAAFFFDMWRFAGIRQVLAYFSNDPLPLPLEPLQVRGFYTLTRHPLYFFSMMVLWFSPIITFNIFLFNIGATLYFIVGSLIEEGRMERVYGDEYRAYRRRVSWLIPWPPRQRDSETPISVKRY